MTRMCYRRRFGRAAVAVLLLGTWAGSLQVPAEVLPRAPYELRNRLSAARKAIERARYAEAVRALDALLGTEEADGFAGAAAQRGLHRPVRAKAAALLASLPAEALEHYETWVGSRARQLLREAAARRDRAALARIAGEYPGATAGGEAALLLGCDALDRGRPREALAWLGRLERVPAIARRFEPQRSLALAVAWLSLGRSDRAARVLGDLASAGSQVRFRIGDEEFSCSDDPERALAWLAHSLAPVPAAETAKIEGWPVFRGDASRNAPSAWQGGIGPLLWRVDALENRELAEAFRSTESHSRAAQHTLLPSAHPLVVGSLVLSRTPERLVAIDLQSGRRIWEPPWDSDPQPAEPQHAHLRRLLGANREARVLQRSFLDAPYGQLASDGCRVYFIDGLSSTWPNRMSVMVALGGGRGRRASGAPKPHNRLVALVLKQEGKMAWSVGAASGEDEPKLAGAFFLGPPLPHHETLYVLAEVDGEITLCALEAATGRLLWSGVVAVPQQSVLDDPERRLAGATPSMADGVLICPTSAGAVVAVEPATRSLLWGYEYPAAHGGDRTRRIQRLGVAALRAGVAVGQPGSCDSSATLAGGHVVLAPVESDELLCLDLSTGELVWKRELDDLLYVGCVYGTTVLTVGAAGLSAWNLATGKPTWRELAVALPGDARAAGRGVRSGRFYYLPTTAPEVLEIDLADGRIVERLKTAAPLGNLVALPGLLISQSVRGVEAFGTPPVRAGGSSSPPPNNAAGEATTKTQEADNAK